MLINARAYILNFSTIIQRPPVCVAGISPESELCALAGGPSCCSLCPIGPPGPPAGPVVGTGPELQAEMAQI